MDPKMPTAVPVGEHVELVDPGQDLRLERRS